MKGIKSKHHIFGGLLVKAALLQRLHECPHKHQRAKRVVLGSRRLGTEQNLQPQDQRIQLRFVVSVEALGNPIQQQNALHFSNVNQTQRHAVQPFSQIRPPNVYVNRLGEGNTQFRVHGFLKGMLIMAIKECRLLVQQHGGCTPVVGLLHVRSGVSQVQQIGTYALELIDLTVRAITECLANQNTRVSTRLPMRIQTGST